MPRTRTPIFILGVPRSGTTLLRTILDSHPNIAAGPETPWLAAHQPRSLGGLYEFLTQSPHGYCASFGIDKPVVTDAVRAFADSLFSAYAQSRGKQRWAEKTPDDLLHLNFLLEVFPDATFIKIERDGLDTAVSTAIVADHRKGISDRHEKRLAFGKSCTVKNNAFNALLRWNHWNRLIDTAMEGREIVKVRYEDLVNDTEPTLRRLLESLDEPFDPCVLNYADAKHDYPDWEWGSADVKHHGRIVNDRIGRAARELEPVELELLSPLVATGEQSQPAPLAQLARVNELDDPRFKVFLKNLNSFAGPLGLRQFTNWSKIWEYPFLWHNALCQVHWPDKHLVDLGSELSPMPWVAALLGARVTLIETDRQFIPLWEKLKAGLRVDVDWHIVDSEHIPLKDAAADILTSFSVIEHQPNKRAAVDEAARVLKTGGVFALSYDICEPKMGMTFPEWNGRALTLQEFEQDLWMHSAFGAAATPQWNMDDVEPFLKWHRTTAEHHNYVVGAAVMLKSS